MIAALRRLVLGCDAVNEAVGRALAWLTLGIVAATLAVVALRYGLGIGRIWLQEVAMYLHAAVFMLGAGYTLARRGHVRIDVFYRRFGRRTQALVDLLGTVVLLLPMAGVVLAWSAGYAATAWARLEGSPETGGLPLVFVLKTFIPAMAALLVVQAVAELGRNALVLAGAAPPPAPGETDP